MYDPPSKDNWHSTEFFDEHHKECYDLGYNDAKSGKPYTVPYPNESPYGYKDGYNQQYYSGYYDYNSD